MAEIETTSGGADLAALAKAFDEEIADDVAEWPRCSLFAPLSVVHRYELSRLIRVTLKVARRMGKDGIPVEQLRHVYAALEVPWSVAEFIERKLQLDGVGGIVDGRLTFTGSAGAWARLAETRAE